LRGDYFSRKFAFKKVHEIVKDIKDIRFFLNKINPSELAKIINEAYIVIVPTYGCGRITPNIRKNLLEWNSRHTCGNRISKLMTLSFLTRITK
jgi:protein involved in ribonucleotide reduction